MELYYVFDLQSYRVSICFSIKRWSQNAGSIETLGIGVANVIHTAALFPDVLILNVKY